MNENITVLPDESLGGVLREYREVKRKARAGELIKIINNVAGHGLPIGHVCKAKNADCADGWSLCNVEDAAEPDYVVLEPIDIVYVDDRKYRMVDREAAVGERVIIVNVEEDVSEELGYKNGQVYEVKELFDGYPFIWTGDTAGSEVYLEREEYRVLDPVEEAPLSTQPATDQIAENIANLTAKVTELETRINALEEGVADDIKALKSRVATLECVKVASGPVDTTPPDFIKTPQQIRDEIVERAKDDVKALLNTPEYGIEALDGAYISYIPHIHRVKFVINRDKRTIVALVQDRRTDKLRLRGIAKCAPGDVFNAHIGRAIALRRALGLEVPAEYLNAPNPMEVRVGDVLQGGKVVYAVRPTHRTVGPGAGHAFAAASDGYTYINEKGHESWGFLEYAEIIDDTRESEKGAAA